MDTTISTAAGPLGDFAEGERTEAPVTGAILGGDFAAGERTEPLTPEEQQAEILGGDFAAGERTVALTVEDETPGTFADTSS